MPPDTRRSTPPRTHGVALVVTHLLLRRCRDDLPQFEKFEEIMRRHGGELLPVFLHCSSGRKPRAGSAIPTGWSGAR